jgi:sarcosine oxidase subunit delta
VRSNIKGIHAERWRHARGCGRFFNALRDTRTDHFAATYEIGAPKPELAAAPDMALAPVRAGTPEAADGSEDPK